jgi:hypothetical protein
MPRRCRRAAKPPDLQHEAQLKPSLKALWASRDIIYTLAERDIRAQYKQATLGLLWALIAPLAMLAIFTIIFSRTKSLGIPGIPYPIFAYIGILCWTFFSQALGTGGTVDDDQPRPHEQDPVPAGVLSSRDHPGDGGEHPPVVDPPGGALYPLWVCPVSHDRVGAAPDGDRVALHHRGHARGVCPDHPDARPRSGTSHHDPAGAVRHPGHLAIQETFPTVAIVYGFFSPLGPVIDDARRAMLLGLNPVPGPLLAAVAGTACYVLLGYRLFKRLEVNFADIA